MWKNVKQSFVSDSAYPKWPRNTVACSYQLWNIIFQYGVTTFFFELITILESSVTESSYFSNFVLRAPILLWMLQFYWNSTNRRIFQKNWFSRVHARAGVCIIKSEKYELSAFTGKKLLIWIKTRDFGENRNL